MLMRFDPFRELDRMAQSLGSQAGAIPRLMVMDAYREGDRFVVHLDVPGVDPNDIDLTVEKNVLTVSAERRWDTDDDQQIVVNERPQGTFSRQLFLGDSLDADRVEATCERGVMTITIPVSEQAKPRRVEVASGDSGRTAIDATASEDE
jgi:HSP20 family protein